MEIRGICEQAKQRLFTLHITRNLATIIAVQRMDAIECTRKHSVSEIIWSRSYCDIFRVLVRCRPFVSLPPSAVEEQSEQRQYLELEHEVRVAERQFRRRIDGPEDPFVEEPEAR